MKLDSAKCEIVYRDDLAALPTESVVVSLRTAGSREPLCLLHGVDGGIDRFRKLAERLPADQPVLAVRAQALLENSASLTRVESLAAFYLAEVRRVYPTGRLHLLGYSFGGYLAYEMGRLLEATSEPAGMIGLLDTMPMTDGGAGGKKGPSPGSEPVPPASQVPPAGTRPQKHLRRLGEKLEARSFRFFYTVFDRAGWPIPRRLRRAYDINWFAAVQYRPQPFSGRMVLFTSNGSDGELAAARWAGLARGGVEVCLTTGTHEQFFDDPHLANLAQAIAGYLDERPAR